MGAGVDATLRAVGAGCRHPGPPQTPERRPLHRNLSREQRIFRYGLSLRPGSFRQALPHLDHQKASEVSLPVLTSGNRLLTSGKRMRPETLYTLVCRPALPKDTPDVMELTSTIWEGEDYVPHVWSEWLADPEGLLAVAEYGGRVVGLSKLTRLGPAEWWLEGLRVHPDFEGRGIASHLHEYLLDFWQRTGSGVIRLGTASFRKPVQHLCDRTGFRKVAEYSIFSAPVLPGSDSNSTATNFTPINIDEAQTAVDLALQSPALSLVYGLMDTGWQWATPAAHS